MKRLIYYIIVSVLVCLVTSIIYLRTSFYLFEVKIKKIAEINIPNKTYAINLYYIPENATAQSIIQVKGQLYDHEIVLQNYEGYNFVNNYEIINDTTLQLVLSDTTFLKAGFKL